MMNDHPMSGQDKYSQKSEHSLGEPAAGIATPNANVPGGLNSVASSWEEDRWIAEAVASDVYVRVRRRVFRQLLESAVYEGLAPIAEEAGGVETRFTLSGVDAEGQPVAYVCFGRRRLTFGRIRLSAEPVQRVDAEGRTAEADSLTRFVAEVLKPAGADSGKALAFSEELERTLLNDTLAQYERQHRSRVMHGQSYDALEGDLTDGHPYHPSYKSRIGFDPSEQLRYGPEFHPELRLLWFAAEREHALLALDEGLSWADVWAKELGERQVAAFEAVLRERGLDPARYVFLPAHPWQWRKQIAPALAGELQSGRLVMLGPGEDVHKPQQSIRTVANATEPKRSYVKLSMNLINTSSTRLIQPHLIASAPPISRWLRQTADSDSYLSKEARVILLREYAGAAYPLPASSEDGLPSPLAAGALGCIWRESVHAYLAPGEEAVPFNAIAAAELDGTSFIAPWIKRWGLESWLQRLIETSALPVVHLAVVHGLALESHAQNMVLVLKDGMPERVALKDFHEDVMFFRPFLKEPAACPDFATLSEAFARPGEGDSFERLALAPLRHLTIGALFFINLGELAMMLEDRFGLAEERFWAIAAAVVEAHRQRFPEHEERFRELDVFVPFTRVEQLTKRRLYVERSGLMHEVPNPLAAARANLLQASTQV